MKNGKENNKEHVVFVQGKAEINATISINYNLYCICFDISELDIGLHFTIFANSSGTDMLCDYTPTQKFLLSVLRLWNCTSENVPCMIGLLH